MANTGYSYNNWTPSFPSTITASATYTANFVINQYTITFNSDGGSAVSPITQNYGTVVAAPANPTKAGYTFNGWNPAVPATMPAANTTCVAQWTAVPTYTVTFQAGANEFPDRGTTSFSKYCQRNSLWSAVSVPTPVANTGYKL